MASLLLTVTAIRQERDDVKTLVLRPDRPFAQIAGQFLTLRLPVAGGGELRRSYSLSNTPLLGEPPTLTVKRVPNGAASRVLFDQTKVGDVLNAIGPSGLFTLPDPVEHGSRFFFWAAGVGITPILPLLQTLLLAHPEATACLVYSNRSRADVLFGERLESLETAYPGRFRMQPLYSTAKDLSRARLHRGLIPVLLRELGDATPPERQWHYICGPLDYRRMAAWGLEEAGVPAARIKKEIFHVDQPVARVQPPDTGTHTVSVRTGTTAATFPVAYPDSILAAAKKAGVALPYSCEAGRCGSCAVRCMQGMVWHDSNEVLTEADLARGLILTCTGHPVGGDVVLQPA